MSPRKSSNPQGAAAPATYRKPRPDFYTVLLVIALVALLIGILFLYLELNYYDMNVRAPQALLHRRSGTPCLTQTALAAGLPAYPFDWNCQARCA